MKPGVWLCNMMGNRNPRPFRLKIKIKRRKSELKIRKRKKKRRSNLIQPNYALNYLSKIKSSRIRALNQLKFLSQPQSLILKLLKLKKGRN
jgi:hypothetical protein